ncbi:UDP-2,3-diacylglucosamine diphosphatase [Marinimicrobium alkaliphilum]|uniref:UDP-2,3-diacylglucosamine diphosphatase n=1 Tax=Marinimicrobium alkaliphilum TaxID=2202654 RepID=UPI000DBA56BC|nr:UDP-2,3-diacylglucosamine diphosphatase [Marinimicrobium alkaliphilum]
MTPGSTLANPLHARTIWISDLHLGYRDCKADYLLEFLDRIRCETLYLVGDVIDLWALKKRFCWPAQHYQVLLKLYELADKGVRVIYVPGNHDEPLRHFCGDQFGAIEVALEHEYVSADGKRWLVMHGDAMDAHINLSWVTRFCGDIAYDALLFINRWANRWRKLTGRPYFSLAGLIKSNVKGAQKAIETYQNEAMDEARRRGYDGVICGHIHAAALLEQNGIRYANTGDWVESCSALLEDHQGHLRLLHYSDQLHWQAEQAPSASAEGRVAKAA